MGATRGGCTAPWPLVVRSRDRSREVRADGFPYGIRAASGGGVRPPTGEQRSSCDWHLWLRGFCELGASRPAFQNDPPPSKPVIPLHTFYQGSQPANAHSQADPHVRPFNPPKRTTRLCASDYQATSGAVSIAEARATSLYIVMSVKACPRMPSWIAQLRPRTPSS